MNPSTQPADRAQSELSPAEMLRYSRHLVIPEWGQAAQQKLKAARVLLIGMGGLGSPAAMYLAAAGVGTLGIVDHDVVDESNLQRQIIHGQSDVGRAKVDSAAATLADLNPFITLRSYNTPLSSANALDIIRDYDLVIDCSDNFPTRYLVNDACVLLGKLNVYGSVFRFEGQVSVLGAPGGPCYRCLFPTPPPPGLVPSCAESGVLGVVPGTIGTLQATEAIKLITGLGEPLVGRMLLYDALAMTWDTLAFRKNPHCPVCGDHPTVTVLIDYDQFCGLPRRVPSITVRELRARLDGGERLFLLDVREPAETMVSRLQGAVLIPKDTVLHHLDQIPHDLPVIVYCRRGVRSADVVRWLEDAGFTNAINLEGGIMAWASEIDPSLPVA